MDYSRLAIYYLPPDPGAFSAFGASWLGWDIERACAVPQPDIPGIVEVTRAPRRYGFHGTLKPPFRLADGCDIKALSAETDALARNLPAFDLPGLEPVALGRFLALVPQGGIAEIAALAARLVRDLDRFRAPPTEAEIARRRGALSVRQEANLLTWGYPFVMEDFRFHLTLTDRLSKPRRAEVWGVLAALLPDLSRPLPVREIALVGERTDGMFERVDRFALRG